MLIQWIRNVLFGELNHGLPSVLAYQPPMRRSDLLACHIANATWRARVAQWRLPS